MTKIGFCSDIHLEFGHLDLFNRDNIDVLVLAGDISTPHTWSQNHNSSVRKSRALQRRFFNQVSKEFPVVLYIPGNHEHYHGDYYNTEIVLKTQLADFTNIVIGNHIEYFYNDIAFIGNTLWSDFEGASPMSFIHTNMDINDFRLITMNNVRFCSQYAYDLHTLAIKSIENSIQKAVKSNKKSIIFTHHLPSLQVISPVFRDDRLNGAYASDLDWFIEKYEPLIWIHGHSHPPIDKMIGKTRVMRNPRGYVGYEHSFEQDKLYSYKVIEV